MKQKRNSKKKRPATNELTVTEGCGHETPENVTELGSRSVESVTFTNQGCCPEQVKINTQSSRSVKIPRNEMSSCSEPIPSKETGCYPKDKSEGQIQTESNHTPTYRELDVTTPENERRKRKKDKTAFKTQRREVTIEQDLEEETLSSETDDEDLFTVIQKKERTVSQTVGTAGAVKRARRLDVKEIMRALPEFTPNAFEHKYIGAHTNGALFKPKEMDFVFKIREEDCRAEIDLSKLTASAYTVSTRVDKLFPRETPNPNAFDMMSFGAACRIRKEATTWRNRLKEAASKTKESSISKTLLSIDEKEAEKFKGHDQNPQEMKVKPLRFNEEHSYPVLFQCMAVNPAQGAIIEAKDHCLFLSGREDLHLLKFDQYAINIATERRGFDTNKFSIGDLIWVYSIKPTFAANTLKGYTKAIEAASNSVHRMIEFPTLIFRVAEFSFIRPHAEPNEVLAFINFAVLDTSKIKEHQREERAQQGRRPMMIDKRTGKIVKNRDYRGNPEFMRYSISAKGSKEMVFITPTLFPREERAKIQADSYIRTTTRAICSSAVRFSAWPASRAAARKIKELVASLQPPFVREAPLPMSARILSEEEKEWIEDRQEDFLKFDIEDPKCLLRMSELQATDAAALAFAASADFESKRKQVNFIVDKRNEHLVILKTKILNMKNQKGWIAGAAVSIALPNLISHQRVTVESSNLNIEEQSLEIELLSGTWSSKAIFQAIGDREVVTGTMRLCPTAEEADPIFSILSSLPAPKFPKGCMIRQIFQKIYTPRSKGDSKRQGEEGIPTATPEMISVEGKEVVLDSYQSFAIKLMTSEEQIVMIKAPAGAGKTVLAAEAAKRLVKKGHTVLVISMTNNAIAQATTAVEKSAEGEEIKVLRLARSTELETTTNSDLYGLIEQFVKNMTEEDEDSSETSQVEVPEEWEPIVQIVLARREMLQIAPTRAALRDCTDEEIEVYRKLSNIVEKKTPAAIKEFIKFYKPTIITATVSAILNHAGSEGCIRHLLKEDKVTIIGDEASQMPEPVITTLGSLLPQAKMRFIGDPQQLEPFCKMDRERPPAKTTARGVATILSQAEGVPKAELRLSYRAHPALLELTSKLFYNNRLTSGIGPTERNNLLQQLAFPNSGLPGILIRHTGKETLEGPGTIWNKEEIDLTEKIIKTLILARVPPSEILVVGPYAYQVTRAKERLENYGATVCTIDSAQGKEVEVTIVHTTRSQPPKDHHFYDDFRRINMATSRPRAALFVIAHEEALSSPNWKALDSHFRERNAEVRGELLDFEAFRRKEEPEAELAKKEEPRARRIKEATESDRGERGGRTPSPDHMTPFILRP